MELSHPKNAFVSAFLLCITWISSGFFRNPHYHSSASAMPVMSSVVMMANAYGSDGDYAMGEILVTTICSVFTLHLFTGFFFILSDDLNIILFYKYL